jgi:hypothetical protein
MDHNHQQSSHMSLGGPTLLWPLMPLVDQYLRTHFKSYKLRTDNQTFINRKKDIHKP